MLGPAIPHLYGVSQDDVVWKTPLQGLPYRSFCTLTGIE